MLTGNGAMAQGNGNGHGKGHDKHGAEDDQEDHYYKDHDRETHAGGMTSIRTISRRDSPRKTVCLLDWKNNWCAAARSHQAFRNGSNLFP